MVMPRYQRRGIGIAAMPSVSTVGMQEAARTSQTLAAALDRVSGFVFKRAELEAQVKGAEFGAMNTPTLEELKDGKYEVAGEVAGDQMTVFGRAARKASLEGLLTEFEMEANRAMTELRVQFAQEKITSEQLRAGIADLNQGLTEALSSVDPTAASALTKGIQTTGNSVYLNALTKEQDLRRKQKEVIAEREMRELIDGIPGVVSGMVEEIVRAGGNFDPNGQFISIEDKIENVILPELERMSIELSSPEFYSKYADKVTQKISETKVAVVFETVTQDTLNLFSDDEQLQSKTLEQNPKVKMLYDSLTIEERESVRDQVDAFLDEEQAERDAADQRLIRQREKKAFELSVQLQQAITKNADEEEIRDLIVQLENTDPGKAASFREVALSGGGQVDQADVKRQLLVARTTGRLTIEMLNKAYSDRHITKSTYESMFTSYGQQQDNRYKDGLRVLKNAIGYPEYDSVANGPVQRDAVIKLAEIENEYLRLREEAIKAGETPRDPFDFFNEKALKANEYTPEQRQNDINAVLNVYGYDGFESWAKMLETAKQEFRDAVITPVQYNSIVGPLEKLIENNVSYGPYEAAQ